MRTLICALCQGPGDMVDEIKLTPPGVNLTKLAITAAPTHQRAKALQMGMQRLSASWLPQEGSGGSRTYAGEPGCFRSLRALISCGGTVLHDQSIKLCGFMANAKLSQR